MRYSTAVLAMTLTLSLVGCGSEGAGTYVIDTENLIEVISEQAMKMPGMTDEMKDMALGEAKKQAEQMKLELVLNSDGSLVSTFEIMGNKEEAKGTWKLEGDKLTMTNTWENGEDLEEEDYDTAVATYKSGEIHITPEGAPFSLKLVKK